MTLYIENHGMLNDVKKLKAKDKHSYSGLARFKRVMEKKDTDPDYQRMLGLIMSRAESHRQPNTLNNIITYGNNDAPTDPDYQRMLGLIMGRAESHRQPNTQNNIITYGNNDVAWSSDSQDGLLLGKPKKPDNSTRPLHIKCKGMSGSKLKHDSRHKLCTKAKGFVEKTDVDRAEENRYLVWNDVDSAPFHQEPNRASSRLSQMKISHAERAGHVMKSRKGKDVVEEESEDMKPLIRFKGVKPDPKRVLLLKSTKKDKSGLAGKCVQQENGHFLSPETEDYNAKARFSRKRMKGGITKTEGVKKRFERFDDGETDIDLEFPDDTVRSKRCRKTIEEGTKVCRIGSTSASNGFRKHVLDVLRKPFDEGELKRLLEAVEDGPYYDYHPDLEEKLKRSRFKRRKSLNILRGFFFWLQNVAREGVFKPWRDDECLAVKPAKPEKSPRSKQPKRKRR